MKQSRKTIALLAAVLVLVILLLFANRNMTRQSLQRAGETVSPSPSAVTPTVTASLHDLRITATHIALLPKFPTIPPPPAKTVTPTMIVSPTATSTLQPPACSFPLANVKYLESKPEEYTFSEPQVVLTAPEGNPLNVAQWLPDNQQILMTEELRNQYVESNDTLIQQSISLYNIETGESKLYAMDASKYEPPIWSPDMNGVVYSFANYTHIDKKNASYKFTRQLRVSYGDLNATQLLADNLSWFPLTMQPGGSEILYFSEKQVSKLDKSLKKLASASFDPAQWDYAKERRNDEPVYFQMAWQPGTPLVFLYSGAGLSSGGGYTFIFDTTSGSICELNLGGWAYIAHWSMDGRYLAIERENGYSFPVPSNDFVILDTLTGSLRTVDIVSQDVEKHHATDFTWTPDNLHLLVLEDIPSTYDPNNFETIHHELYFVDLTTGQSTPLFPEFKSFLAGGSRGMNTFAWSPDGSKLLVRCPSLTGRTTDRFCLISVQKIGQ
jgi:hypothetical protein